MLLKLIFLLFCQKILADSLLKPFYETKNFETIGRHFENFLRTHNKIYDETEKVQRFVIFIANVNKINELNSRYEKTTFDINHFTDWTEQELISLRGFKLPEDGPDPNGNCKVQGDPTTKDAPAAFNWCDHGAVSPVKNQMSCGSCWAFSTAALVESRYLQKKEKKLSLSEQQLVDCDKISQGCGGGLPSLALTYLMQSGGQETEEAYPYENKDGTCRFDKSKVAAKVLSCTTHNLTSEEALKELLLKEGPISIGVAASHWESYKGGIWTKCDAHVVDHAVLLVGYGSENGVDFWIIKNSYGDQWGEKGFIRIQRGVNCDTIAAVGLNQPYAATTATVA